MVNNGRPGPVPFYRGIVFDWQSKNKGGEAQAFIKALLGNGTDLYGY
ncbi:hypothetical protein GCM10028774_33160 [Spirosoma jeollabukense]